jgi:thiol:disulfide interchange protein
MTGLRLLLFIGATFALAGCPPEKPARTAGGRQALAGYRAYDETADGAAQIAAAAAEAKATGKRVLVMFGGNWCRWCRALDAALATGEAKAALERGFVLVHVDSETNLALNERYGDPFRFGFPVLVVLDSAGERLHVQPSGAFEMGDSTVRHDPEKVLVFLRRWAPPA